MKKFVPCFIQVLLLKLNVFKYYVISHFLIPAKYISLAQLFKSKLDALSSQHGLKCEELKRTEAELANLKKEQGDLLCRIKEQEQDANLSNDLQVS